MRERRERKRVRKMVGIVYSIVERNMVCGVLREQSRGTNHNRRRGIAIKDIWTFL